MEHSQKHRKGEEDDASNDQLYECPHCGREFTRPGGLGKHLLSCGPHAKPPDALKCLLCGRSFRQPSGLAVHMKSCKAGQQLSIDQSTACNLPTTDTHPSHDQSIVCPCCARTFKSRGGLGRHMLSCKGPQMSSSSQDHLCPVCELPFKTKSGLSSHLRWKHKDVNLEELTSTEDAATDLSLQESICKTTESASPHPATGPQTPHSARGSDDNFTATETVGLTHSPSFTPANLEHTDYERQKRLCLPPANATRTWMQADETIDLSLKQACPAFNKLSPDNMLSTLTDAIRFFFPEQKLSNQERKQEGAQHKLRHLRQRKRKLRREWRNRRNEPPQATATLRSEFHAVHRRIKRLSAHMQSADAERDRWKQNRAFRADPFQYGKKFFDQKSAEKPSFSAEDALRYFSQTYADEDRASGYDSFPDVTDVPEPSVCFPQTVPPFSLFANCLRKTRNSSSPGPNGIPYIVWKKCPSLQHRLYTVCCKVWKSTNIPSCWRRAVIVLMHKAGDSSNPSNFRPIALSNCDGKIFFSLVSAQLTSFMCSNKYFDGCLQKGFLPRLSGCVEHSTLSVEALRDAKENHRSICFAWIDFRNAFGSVRHMLLQRCLTHFHLPERLCRIVFNYYDQLTAKVVIGKDLTPAFHFAIGVFQGCTLSPTLFNICIQPLLDTLHSQASSKGWSYTFKSDPTISRDVSAYADDIELCTWTTPGCQSLLRLTDRYLDWTRSLTARPDKCFSTALRLFNAGSTRDTSQYVSYDPGLTIAGEQLQYLGSNNFKYLGRPINSDLSENLCRQSIVSNLASLLNKLDAAPLSVSAKLWLYNHFVVSKMAWPLQANDLCLSFVKELQAQATKALKKWTGLPRCANPSILFVGDQKQTGLRVKSLTTVWKQQQHVKFNLLQTSLDPRCKSLAAIICKRQDRWSRKFAPVVLAEDCRVIVEANCQIVESQNATLPSPQHPPLSHRDVRRKVNSYIRDIDVTEQLDKLRTLQMQGRWLEWSEQMHMDLSWNRLIYNWSDAELRFALQATTDTAPTATNLHRWGHHEIDTACKLCGRLATLRHAVNACSFAFTQGRYTWRHNSVLAAIKHGIVAFWALPATQEAVKTTIAASKSRFIQFVRPGYDKTKHTATSRRPLSSQSILLQADDWQFLFDIGPTQLVFPPELAVTIQRPDGVFYSLGTKTVVLLELTVPLEDRIQEAHDRKKERYKKLKKACEQNGFKVHLMPIEVGCLGYCPHSLLQSLETLGLPRSTARHIRTECSRVALRCSYLLYLRREIREWTTLQPLY